MQEVFQVSCRQILMCLEWHSSTILSLNVHRSTKPTKTAPTIKNSILNIALYNAERCLDDLSDTSSSWLSTLLFFRYISLILLFAHLCKGFHLLSTPSSSFLLLIFVLIFFFLSTILGATRDRRDRQILNLGEFGGGCWCHRGMIAPVRRAFTAKALVPRLNCRLSAGRTAQPLPLLAIQQRCTGIIIIKK